MGFSDYLEIKPDRFEAETLRSGLPYVILIAAVDVHVCKGFSSILNTVNVRCFSFNINC